jgi:aspartate/methionine/tyrosine aminotransferase
MATFFNRYFNPSSPVLQEYVMVTNGNSSLIDNLTWSLFDAGDAVILPTPTYAMFPFNLESRAGVRSIFVPLTDLGDQFHADYAKQVVEKFEKAFVKATSEGTRVQGVLLCNPNNPIGRCYSKNTVFEIFKFCRKHSLHLITDEVYAMTCFSETEEEADGRAMDGFTSALSIPHDDQYRDEIDNIHVTYGVSKDFGMGGMRLGFLVSRNPRLREMIEQLGQVSILRLFLSW